MHIKDLLRLNNSNLHIENHKNNVNTGHLTQQVKRIAEYDRYLQNLLAETDPTHQDYKTLNSAVKRINAIKHIADLDECNSEVHNETDTSDLMVSSEQTDKSQKTRSLAGNKRDGSSAIIFKHLTVGSKFRTGSNWTQNMGWRPDADSDGFGNPDSERMYVMEGPVLFTSGSTKQDRYLFLFSDILLVAKEKSSSAFKLKYRINVTDLWIACIEAADNTMPADRSFVIGWTSTNLIATFSDAETKEIWLKNIKECRNAEKAKQQLKAIASARQSQDTDESEDEAYFEGTAKTTKSKKSPLLNIFKKSSRGEDTNVNELTQPRGKLFGQPLETVCTTDNEPPKHVLSMLEIVFREGAYTTGIFRKSANARVCRDIKKHIDESDNISLEDHQVLAIGSVLKDYLRSIPKSLLLEDLFEEWMKAEKLEEKGEQIKKVKELLMTRLPTCHLTLLKYVICVLHQIDQNSEENKMSASNLAVCIAPSLLSSKQTNVNTNPMSINSAIKVVQLMIENCTQIFGDNIVQLFGTSMGHKIRPDSDSDSMHSILSMQESTGGMRRDGSSMDSLVEGELYQGESSPKPVKSHLSPSNLSRDSGLTLSDSQLYDDDIPEIGHPDRKSYLRSLSNQERSLQYGDMGGLFSQSLESSSSFEGQEPVAPPRRNKNFPTSSTFEMFINYPRPQSAYNRIGTGRAVRSHPDLGKRHSGDSLKSVEEAAEDFSGDVPKTVESRKMSSRFRDSEPALTTREQIVRQKAISDNTPPLSPQSQSNSYFTSSRDSLTSESSRSYDSSSIQSNQFSGEDISETSMGDSFASTIIVNHCGTPENQILLSSSSSNNSQSSLDNSSDKSIPIEIPTKSTTNLYPSDISIQSKVSSPIISVTQCSSSSEEKLADDDYNGFKKNNTPPMELPQQRDHKPKVNKSYGSPPPRVVLGNLKEQNIIDTSFKIHADTVKSSAAVFHPLTKRRNSLDSLSDFRIEQKTNELKNSSQNLIRSPRQHVTVISRCQIPSHFTKNFVSMTDLSNINAERVKEGKRPSEPPSYNEAVQRNYRLLHGLPLEISDQDTVKQKEASARAKQLYQQSVQTYHNTSDEPDLQLKPSRNTENSNKVRSSDINAQLIEDNDVYVTLSRNPRKIYEESMQLYEKTVAQEPSESVTVTPNVETDITTSNISLHRSQSDVTQRPMSKLTLRLKEQQNQTQSTSCLETNSDKSKIGNISRVSPPSYKHAISSKQTIQDYTQPESTQIPIIVDKTVINKNQNTLSSAPSKGDQTVLRKQTLAPKLRPVSEALPWSVSAMKQMWDTKGSGSDSGEPQLRTAACPPPYQPPPPFKKDYSANRLSVSSNSSAGSYGTLPSNTNTSRSGHPSSDRSFNSSEDLNNSSSSVSHSKPDSSATGYSDVSYV